MMEGWTKGYLSDLIIFQRGFDITKANQRIGTVPVISSSGINSYHDEFKSLGPGIIIGRKGTLGSVHFCAGPYWPHDTTLWSKKIYGEIRFIYYLLKVLNLGHYDVGNANPTLNRNHIHRLKINIPPRSTQSKISSILSGYDDLIENNQNRIKLLEEQAQKTYEESFSVKGIPKGWKEYSLGELIGYNIGGGWGEEEKQTDFSEQAYVIRGTDMDNLPMGCLEKVPLRWHKKSNLKSRKLQDGDVVFEVSGGSTYEGVAKTILITEGLLGQFSADVMCASFCKLMRPINKELSFVLILFLKYLRKTKGTEIFEKRSASNIVNYNWEAFLKYQKIKLPDDGMIKKFNQRVEPLINGIYILGNQITKLKEARDILLPRLMTGTIDPYVNSGQVVEELEVDEKLGMVAEEQEKYKKL